VRPEVRAAILESMRGRLLDVVSERPGFDWAGAVVVSGLHLLLVTLTDRFDVLSALTADERVDLYATAINPAAILVGFTLAALGFTYAGEGRRSTLLRTRGHGGLRRTWMAAVSGPLAAVGLLLASQVAEHHGVSATRWMAELVFVFLAARTARFVWLLGQLLDLRQLDEGERRRPAPVSRWGRKAG
jgi:hypothetical protein